METELERAASNARTGAPYDSGSTTFCGS
jgi:hypothetical protein